MADTRAVPKGAQRAFLSAVPMVALTADLLADPKADPRAAQKVGQ
jgi:hypothetical protein